MSANPKLPISVIIPTYNSMPVIKDHIKGINPWIESVSEVIIVDSESRDGTIEYIKSNINSVETNFISNPLGLYESWNRAIRAARYDYIYFSTVCDLISNEALIQLYEIASSNNADVVLSPPKIISPDGREVKKRWPIHHFIKEKRINETYNLSPKELLVYNTIFLPGTLIGSSASNLYRASILKNSPFPTNCGHAGDSGWAIEQSKSTRWYVAPNVESQFLMHNKVRNSRERSMARDNLHKKALIAWESYFSNHDDARFKSEIDQYMDLCVSRLEIKNKLKVLKKNVLPWYLSPRIWLLRHQNKKIKRDMHLLQKSLILTAD